ncbi:MAG: ANTAR domain-containing response regulator [Thiotrichales bacterium]
MPDQQSKKQLRVMLIDDQPGRRELLDEALKEVDCALVACVTDDNDLLATVNKCNPDVILIDLESPGRDTIESLESVSNASPRPMVMFSQDNTNLTIQRATEAGVMAYVADGMKNKRVRPIIDAAMARFEHFNRLESELKKARDQLNERKVIDKAKGIIMQQQGIAEEDAYKALRKLAMDTNRRMVEIAQSIIDAASIFTR